MNIIESFRLAIGALVTNKMRSLLTLLGIVIGVGSVIALLAFGNGYAAFLEGELNKFGVGSFYVIPGVDSRRADVTLTPQLTASDAEALAAPGFSPNVKNVAAVIQNRVTVTAGGQRVSYDLTGGQPAYFAITANTLGAGRFTTEADEATRARVAVIGSKVAERLYGSISAAIGQRLSIEGVEFEVIGVVTTKALFAGDPQKSIYVPYSSARDWLFRNQFVGKLNVSFLLVQASSRQQVTQTIEDVTALLRARHRLTYQPNDFSIFNLEQLGQQLAGIIGGFNAFLGIVAGISLLVGGIGIMNIMLVSVAERTREIGLRKAVGAKRRDILLQFLVEALMLGLLGGAIGTVFGLALAPVGTLLLQSFLQDQAARALVTPASILLATGVAATISAIFGFFPALQASRMRPIDALRSE